MKLWFLDKDDLNREGGSWSLCGPAGGCSLVRTTSNGTTTAMEAGPHCWFEWLPSPPNDQINIQL